MAAGQLWVVDRGYANPPALAFACEQGGDLLVRYAFGALPLYDAEGGTFDVREAAATLIRAGDVGQWSVWVHPK